MYAKTSNYDHDFYQWTIEQTQFLTLQEWNRLDCLHLQEELEDMGRRQKRSIESNIVILLLHLLKWQYQPAHRSSGWKGSIREHRRRLNKELQESPSLYNYLAEIIDECYGSSRLLASGETGLAEDLFPISCPYSVNQLLETNFLLE